MGPKRTGAVSSKSRKRTKKNGGAFDIEDGGSDHDESAGPSHRRNQMMIDDDDDDVQAGYEDADGHYVGEIFIPPKYVRVDPPQSGERLVIEKIVCENFKSYGGVKEMGPFHKNFSAIVGPNGNGKSNIIDAMLFVFGYRAAKIRCKKVSVLIHKSELLPTLSSCAVTVHFVKIHDDGKNDDSYNVVPNSRITVMRRAYQDNSSGYWLDGKKVTFQNVASFLKINGIDIVHNRFLILQGEVESIAQMPPKTPNGLESGLLEFLEEVIGTKRYLKPLCDLEQKVEQLDYEREEKLQRVDIVEKEKQAMHEPVKKAKDFLRDQNTRSRYQHQIYQVKNLHASKKAEELSSQITPVLEEIKKVNDRLDEIKSINETRKHEFEVEEKAFSAVKSSHDKKKKALEANEAEYVKHFESIKRANDQRKKIQKEKVKKEVEIQKLEEIPRTHDTEKAKLMKRQDDLQGLIQAEEEVVEREMKKLNEKITDVLKKKAETDKEKNKWLPVRHEKSMKVQQINRELEKYKKTESEAKETQQKYQEQLGELERSIEEREGQADMSSLEGKLTDLQGQLQERERELPKVVEEEGEKRQQMVNLSSELQEAKESLEGSGTNDKIYKLFFGEKEQGRLKGLYGRLKDLATIDEKFNVAITVSTSMLEYWVVDHDDTGTQCIQLLKEQGMQFQNFICLNRIKDNEGPMQRRFNPPPNSKRLFDCLNISTPEVAVAFYKALRDTLVCDNIDVASHIGYGKADGRRLRVATLAGELIEPSGSMTGGGRAKIVGKMNTGMAARLTSTVTKKDVEKLQRQYEQLSRELSQLSARKSQLETEIFNIRTQIKATSDQIKNFHSDLQALKNKLPLLQKRLAEQQARARQVSVDPKVMKEKEAALKAAEKEAEDVEENSKEAIDAAAAVDERLNDLKGRQKDEIRKKLDKFKSQFKAVEEEIDKIIVDLKNYEKNKKRAEDKIASIDLEIEKLENDMRTWKQLRDDIEVQSKEIKKEMEKLTEELEAAREALASRKEVLNEFKDEEKKLAKKKVELDAKIEDVSNNLKGLKRLIQHNQQAMEALVLKAIPEEDVPPLAVLPTEDLEALHLKELEAKLAKYEKKLQGESPNLNILEDYNRKVELFLQRVNELDKVTAERDMYRDAFISTTAQRLGEFMEGFAIISSKLKEMFRMISMGGDAELDLVDSTDPFSSGVQFSVRPARKTWKKISNLSGGEKTLSSLALIFALHYFKPSPFYVMDEIDAALDFKNVSIIANYIKDRTKFTQFIIISLRSNMFELADSLLGVYKVDNMSYSIHIGVTKMLSAMKVKLPGEQENGLEGTQQQSEEGTQRTNGASSQSSVATQRVGSQPGCSTQTSGSGSVSNVPSSLGPSSDSLLPPTQPTPESQICGNGLRSPSKVAGEVPSVMPSPIVGLLGGLGRPLSTSTPLRTSTIGARRAEPADGLSGIQEENSAMITQGDDDSSEDGEQDPIAADISQILAGQSGSEKANFEPKDFEFPHSSSSSSDEESEFSATLSD